MAEEKNEFVKELAMSSIKSKSDFSQIEAKQTELKAGAVVSIPRKRKNSDESEEMREKVDKKSKKDKKRSKH